MSLTVRLAQSHIRAAGGATPCAATVSAFCLHFRDAQANGYAPEGPLVSGTSRAGFSRGKKLVACFLKLVARISKSEPLIFSLLPCGINTLKTSFHFSAPENDNFIDNFPLLVETIHRLYYGNENHPAAASAGRQVSVIRAQKNAGMCDVTHMPALVRRFRPLPASSVFTPARPLP